MTTESRPRAVLGLIIALLIVFAAPAVGALFSPTMDGWYAALTKPTWTPPGWLFGPVWTLLYAAMAVAAWVVWRCGAPASPDRRDARTVPLTLFGVQLILNAAWTPLFFGMHRPGLALIDIALLWFVILATLVNFARVTPVAGWLLVPYQAWVTFAGALNFAIWHLNS